jgi:UDP-N-acetylmuramoylalanine--D-glutamate ligase
VTVLEDDAERAAAASAELGEAGVVTVEAAPGAGRAAELAWAADTVVPSPGVPRRHPAVEAAAGAGIPVVGEVGLAWRLVEAKRAAAGAQSGGGGVLVAITGTNGKTTVTELVASMLNFSGLHAVACGNVGFPLLGAVEAWAPEDGRVLVAEVSSFQLEYAAGLAPDVSCWLNFTPDHLDWHPDLEHYRAAKARVWAYQGPGATAVANADDPVVSESARSLPEGVRAVFFGSRDAGGRGAVAWQVEADRVEGPDGFVLKGPQLPRAFPHDLANVAAAAAVASAAGASAEGVREAARAMPVLAHRVELVGEAGGVAWYDDSKATTPASVLAAVAGFSSVVLLAGGQNKGLDLSVLGRAVPPVRAVVAMGASAVQVAAAFTGLVPVRQAASMAEAVDLAAGLARPGDAVLLSPGCASFDWYSSYAQRGEDFTALARQQLSHRTGPDRPQQEV